MKTFLHRVMLVILIPVLYLVLFAGEFIDGVALRFDRIFNTRLRSPKVTPEQVEQLIAEHIPPGSGSSEIFSFLDRQSFRHPEKAFDDVYCDVTGLKNPYLDSKRDIIKKCIVAWITDVGRFLMVREDIRIIFCLDEQNDLVEYIVDKFGTGL